MPGNPGLGAEVLQRQNPFKARKPKSHRTKIHKSLRRVMLDNASLCGHGNHCNSKSNPCNATSQTAVDGEGTLDSVRDCTSLVPCKHAGFLGLTLIRKAGLQNNIGPE